MPGLSDFPARGRITRINGDTILFRPAGTNYELHLNAAAEGYTGPVDQPVGGMMRVSARKIWTVPSGGNFIEPIMGRPRIIQGRVKWLDERELVVQAGAPFIIELPMSNTAIDLAHGPIEVGALVNVTAAPGATFAALASASVR
jgi:hypothetical protein